MFACKCNFFFLSNLMIRFCICSAFLACCSQLMHLQNILIKSSKSVVYALVSTREMAELKVILTSFLIVNAQHCFPVTINEGTLILASKQGAMMSFSHKCNNFYQLIHHHFCKNNINKLMELSCARAASSQFSPPSDKDYFRLGQP